MVCVVAGLWLVTIFTFTVCAALCMPMGHAGAGMAVGQSVAVPVHHGSAAGVGHAAAQQHMPQSEAACCLDRHDSAAAVVPASRLLPGDAAAAAAEAEAKAFLPVRPVPAAGFDPALEKSAHLRPSLAALSISRT